MNDFPVNIFQVACRVFKGNRNGKYKNCFNSNNSYESSNVRWKVVILLRVMSYICLQNGNYFEFGTNIFMKTHFCYLVCYNGFVTIFLSSLECISVFSFLHRQRG